MPHPQPPYLMVVEIDGWQVTSVMCDQTDFDRAVDILQGVFIANASGRTTPVILERLKRGGHLPLVTRGSKTQALFDYFGVKTERMCVAVRGITGMRSGR